MKFRELLEIVAEDWRTHRRDSSLPGFRAVAVHRFGTFVHSLPRGLLRKPLVLAYRLAYVRCRNVYGIELPYSVTLGRHVVFEHQGGIVIHGASVIGDNCIIRQGVTLGNRHLTSPYEAPVLGYGVNVGAGAVLAGKVYVGDGASIGANSVVLDDVEPYATVVGAPARSVHAVTPTGVFEPINN